MMRGDSRPTAGGVKVFPAVSAIVPCALSPFTASARRLYNVLPCAEPIS